MEKSFYHFVLTYRGGDWSDQKSRFAEGAFNDHGFPITSTSFEELSSYIETQADDLLSTTAFDELWDIYRLKYEK